MTPSRRWTRLILTLLLFPAAACGSRTSGSPATRPSTTADDRRLFDEAERAHRAGRPGVAIGAYEQVARSSGESALVRTALLHAGMLRVAEPSIRDVQAAHRLLQQANAMYAPPDAPPATLTAALTLMAHLEDAAQASSAAEGVAARELADRDQEIRALRRTVSVLRQQVQRQEEALRKAAEAAVSPAGQR